MMTQHEFLYDENYQQITSKLLFKVVVILT